MKSRPLALAAVFSLLSLANCECGETLNRVAPKIEIADPFDATISVCADQGIRECSYDFGQVAIGQARFFQFAIKNPSPVDLRLDSIAFDPTSDPAFKLVGEIPTGVSAQGEDGEIVVVQFTPQLESVVSGTLVLTSDAANLDPEEDVIIRFTGNGLDLGGPEISVSPQQCDFGDVGVSVTAFCDLTLENVGQRELLITSTSFTPDTPTNVFGPSGVFPIPTAIQPGTGVSLRLFAQPNMAGEITGTLLIGSTDPNNAEVPVPLRVFGAQAPTAVAEIATVNGNAATGDPTVRPLDDVVLTGVNSQPALATGMIVAYQWEIVDKPAESSIALSTPTQVTTGFFFSSAGGNLQGLDVAGTFTVRLTVQDDQGLFSTNDARVTLNAVPSEALHVQLTWDKPVNDMDLHLIRGSGPYCSQDSCYWANCKATSSSFPEWDGTSGRTPGDPSLDVDDLSGYGPENINVDQPLDNTYTTAVHFFSGSQSTWSTVKIFVNGGLAYESSRETANDDDFWEVAQIQWMNGGAIVVPIDSYDTNWSCPF